MGSVTKFAGSGTRPISLSRYSTPKQLKVRTNLMLYNAPNIDGMTLLHATSYACSTVTLQNELILCYSILKRDTACRQLLNAVT